MLNPSNFEIRVETVRSWILVLVLKHHHNEWPSERNKTLNGTLMKNSHPTKTIREHQ